MNFKKPEFVAFLTGKQKMSDEELEKKRKEPKSKTYERFISKPENKIKKLKAVSNARKRKRDNPGKSV